MKILNLPKLNKELINLPFRIDDNKVYVNYFDEGVQAGFPSPAEDFKEIPLSLDEKYLQNPQATYLIKVAGNSMYPTLQIGDILIVKSDQEFGDSDIGIVSVNQTDFTVKRFDKIKKKLLADNSEFPNIELNEEDTLICLGVVKQLIRDL
ncbi:LexA family protein [Winogradskyella helgolandensis]|uniref:LexA family protein n=1 Tax=Winogradskyella helgolandensis TaxID=2697010 RepID=UPI0015CDFDD5|nr:S24 family peptidase [Winogradskyella helgolandensis]